jgi:hypothetical protein
VTERRLRRIWVPPGRQHSGGEQPLSVHIDLDMALCGQLAGPAMLASTTRSAPNPTFASLKVPAVPRTGKPSTTLTTEDRVILTAAVRRRRNSNAGTRPIVEKTVDGVAIKPAPLFPPTTPEQVFGCLRYEGKPIRLQEMQPGIAAEVRRRHARGRY